jgi:hypothetical protein
VAVVRVRLGVECGREEGNLGGGLSFWENCLPMLRRVLRSGFVDGMKAIDFIG